MGEVLHEATRSRWARAVGVECLVTWLRPVVRTRQGAPSLAGHWTSAVSLAYTEGRASGDVFQRGRVQARWRERRTVGLYTGGSPRWVWVGHRRARESSPMTKT